MGYRSPVPGERLVHASKITRRKQSQTTESGAAPFRPRSSMKLRKNVLQPLRLEIAPLAPRAKRPSPGNTPYRNSVAENLRKIFQSSGDSNSLRFDSRPATLLKEYSEQREDSIAGHLFRTANRIQSMVDSVVVLSIGKAGFGAQAIVQACCQPYWNYLSRADRGSKPRMFFLDTHTDNDTVQGLLHLLGTHRPSTSNRDLDSWTLVVLATEDSTSESSCHTNAWQLEALLSANEKQTGNREIARNERVIAVAPPNGSIARRLGIDGNYDSFSAFPEPAATQCFGPLGLLPATLLGINIMELLAGAAWMSRNFHQDSLQENLVLRFLEWLSRHTTPSEQRDRFHLYNPGLERWKRWYLDLGSGAPSLVSSSLSEQGDIHVVVERSRFDPISLGSADDAQSRLRASIDDRIRVDREQGRSVAEVRIGELDELHTGQWMQFMLLVSASSKLLGLCPPDVAGSQLEVDDGREWME